MADIKAKLQSMVEKLDAIPIAALNPEEYHMLDSIKTELRNLSVTMEETGANLKSIEVNLYRLMFSEINWDTDQFSVLFYVKRELHELNERVKLLVGLGGILTLKDFRCYLGDSLRNIPPMYQKALLGLCGSYLVPPMQNNTAPFENPQLEKTNAPPLLLTSGEAFKAFNPEITHITKFLLCVILTAVLIFQLPPGVQIFLMLLLTAAFSFGLLEMAQSASNTGVTCGSIHLPVFWFTTLSAVGISIIFGLFTLFVIYISWRLSKGKPRAIDNDVSLNDFVGDLEEGN